MLKLLVRIRNSGSFNFQWKTQKKFPLVEILYPLPGGKAANLICYAHDTFTKHVAVKGMTEFVVQHTKAPSGLLNNLSDPTSMEVDHLDVSQGIGLILCSASTNRLRTAENVLNINSINILLEPTIFGVAISGAIRLNLRNSKHTLLAQKKQLFNW